jgi:hypothetical protein
MNQCLLQYAVSAAVIAIVITTTICHRLLHHYHLPLPSLSLPSAATFSIITIAATTISVRATLLT